MPKPSPTKAANNRPMTFDHLKSSKKPTIRKVWIALDPELADEETMLRLRRDAAKIRLEGAPDNEQYKTDFQKLQDEHDELYQQLKEAAVCFKFKALGRRRYQELLDEHPPTPEQLEKAKAEVEGQTDQEGNPLMADLPWNPDTFPDALIAKCLIEPDLSKEEIMSLLSDDNWSSAEVLSLFETALNANAARQLINLGNG